MKKLVIPLETSCLVVYAKKTTVFMYNEPVYIQRTPSDVPRTAELIEMSTGPGKTVTEYDKVRVLNCL